MNRRISKEKIEELRSIPIENLLGRSYKRSGERITAHCPFHNPDDQNEISQSFFIFSGNSYHCFSCGVSGMGAISFIVDRDKVDFIEAVKKLDPAIEYDIELDRLSPEEYLNSKGISDEKTKQKFGIKITKHEGYPAIQFNIPTGVKYRRFGVKPKYKHAVGSKSCIFKSDENDENIGYIAEGEIDSIVLNKFTGIPAWSASTGGASHNIFQKNLETFTKFEKLYFLYDTDKAGKEDIVKIVKIFGLQKCFIVECPVKDWSDYFSLGYTKEDFNILLDISKSSAEYFSSSNDSTQDESKNNDDKYSILNNEEFLELKFPENPWLIQGVIRLKGKTMIVGEGGVGKTKFVYGIIKSVTEGSLWLGRFEIPEPKKILLIDKENDGNEIQSDMLSMGITNKNLYHVVYPPMYQLLQEGENGRELSIEAQKIRDFVITNKIEVVVLDSLVDFFQGNENDPTDVAKFSATCDEIFPNCCTILIHHESKPPNAFKRTPAQRVRGSTHLFNMLNSAISLSVNDSEKPEIIYVEHSKVRGGRKLKPFEVEMVIETDILDPKKTVVKGFKYLGEVQPVLKKIEEAKQEIIFIARSRPHEEISTNQYISLLKDKVGVNAVRDGLKDLVNEKLLLVRNGAKNANYYKFNPESESHSETSVDEFIEGLEKEGEELYRDH